MTKNKVRMAVAAAVVLVLYHLIAFLLPFVKTASFWLAYVFTLASFAVVAYSLAIAFRKGSDTKSKFYGFPIAKIGVTYGALQLVVGLAIMALGLLVPWVVTVLVCAIMLGVALLGVIGADVMRDEVEALDERLAGQVVMMRQLQSKVNQMPAMCEDASARAALQAFSEEIRYSDPVSSPAIAEIEADLGAVIDELQQAVVDGDVEAVKTFCRKGMAVLAERNRLCKLNK